LELSLASVGEIPVRLLALAALARSQAAKVDAWDVIVRWAQEDVAGVRGKRPAVPPFDNVTPSLYLKTLGELGLTAKGLWAPEPKGVAGVPKAHAADASFDPSSV
jgi:hypothetical protein